MTGPAPLGAPATPFATLLEARSAMALDLHPGGTEVLVASNLGGTMQLHRVAEGGDPIAVTAFDEPVTAARYIPGSRDIVLAVDRGGDERFQLRLVRDDGSDLRDLVVDPEFVHLPGPVSADGSLMAYATNRRNGVDFDVIVRSLSDGSERCVVEGFGGVFDRPAAFSPDGRRLAVVRLGPLSTQNSDILVVDLRGDAAPAVCTAHDGVVQNVNPSWYPDSRRLLYSTDRGGEFLDVARFDVDGRRSETVLAAGWDALAWVAPGGRRALTVLNDDGTSRLEVCDPETLRGGARVELPRPGVVVGQPTTPEPRLGRGGDTAVVTLTTTSDPADVWAVDLGRAVMRRITRSPSAIPADLEAVPERHRVQAPDGTRVPVFLYRPRAAAGPPPVVLFIHGGPEAQFMPAFNAVVLHLVDSGFAVLAPNVRGSTGYGKTFASLDDRRLRLDSVADLAAIHDWLPSAGLDATRAALMGGSYGGYMTLAGLAFQPERWAAGVSLVGISSLVTFLENTSPYRRRIREVEYGTLEADRDFLVEASPLTHAHRIRAPLMLVHGGNDPRVPVSEAVQLREALTSRDVPCELVVYPDEGHGLARLTNRLDAYPRISAFLRRVLGRAAPAG